jgi:hypothetical protein
MRRSWPAGGGSTGSSADPQAGQNLAPMGTSSPQTGQAGTSEDPHDRQNREPSRFCVPHARQVITAASLRPSNAGTGFVDSRG